MNRALFLFPAVLSAAFVSSALASDWKLTKTDDGITVYEREVEGSDVLAFKGNGDVDAPIEKVATVIFDTTRAQEWIEDLELSKIVRWLSRTQYVEYDHVGTPFVMKDRDFVSRVVMDAHQQHAKSGGEKVFKFFYKSMTDPQAPETSYVRGDLMNTTFILTSFDHGTKTHVVGEIHCDPKGSVPKWIVNFFQKSWPVDTLEALRKQVQKPDVKADPRIVSLLSGK